MLGSLQTGPALDRPDLLAPCVHAAAGALPDPGEVLVAAIDPELADTAAFCAAYGVAPAVSANCVIVAGRRGPSTRMAAVVVLATTKADVNGAVRRRLDARRASFAAMDEAVAQTEMAYGGITPIGLPGDWPILVDSRVVATDHVVIGSGIRGSKLIVPGVILGQLAGSEIVEALGLPPTST